MSETKGELALKVEISGVDQLAETVGRTTDATVEGIGAFLSRICLPAAEEFGLLLQDKISGWRKRNAIAIEHKAALYASKLERSDNLHAHPRLAMMAIEQGSWSDSDDIQDMWAGLLTSSLTPDGQNDANLVFMNILSQLTRTQVTLFNAACERARKRITVEGWVNSDTLMVTASEAMALAQCDDRDLVDIQMDHIRELGLTDQQTGFDMGAPMAFLTPSPFGLQFFVRCQGFIGPARDYFAAEIALQDANEVMAQ